jgi:heme-degrading monooxygenase HmoA
MIVAAIEYYIEDGQQPEYDRIAADLHAYIVTFPGLISVERFESKSKAGKMLSLSYWEDEAAVLNWRADMRHQYGMSRGKARIFSWYRITVSDVRRDYSFYRAELARTRADLARTRTEGSAKAG